MNKYRLHLGFYTLLLCTALYGGSAHAQWERPVEGGRITNEPGFYSDQVMTIPARSAGHDTFSRMVLDWPMRVTFEVDDSKKGLILLKFKRRVLVDLTGVRTAPETNIGKVEVLSGLNDTLTLGIYIPKDAPYKVYSLGYKVVIDVEDIPGQKRGVFNAEESKPKVKPAEPTPLTAPASAPSVTLPSLPPVPSVAPEPANTVQPVMAPLTLSWTSTKSFDVASFVRHNAIYFITSETDIAFAPRVTEGDASAITLTRLPSESGQIYRALLPKGVKPLVSAAGAGLSWDFTLFPTSKRLPSAAKISLATDKKNKKVLTIALPVDGESIDFQDPDTGEAFTVLPAAAAKEYIDKAMLTPDLEIVPSVVGLAMRALNDQLAITLNGSVVQLSLPQGFSYDESLLKKEPPPATITNPIAPEVSSSSPRLLYFSRWTAGLPQNYAEARQQLQDKLLGAAPDKLAENLIVLARFHLARGYGPEALGYLDLALEKAPPLLARDPEYKALRGVSLALMGDSENALLDLNDPLLQPIPEIAMWRAFALGLNYDWVNAYKAIPADTSTLAYYPRRIQSPLALSLAEILLRNNKPKDAQQILSRLEQNVKLPDEHEKAAINYLRGEAQRILKQPVKAIEYWNKAAESNDQLYRVKAILARTVLQLQEGAIKPKEAIEKLERLRFAWRGDGLETQIAQVLGRQYLLNKQWDEAFDLMRGAAGFAQGTQEGDAITSAMSQSFSQLFTNPPADLKPIEAISVYDRFPELTPPGEEGKAVLRGLASNLLQVDLLDRAAAIYTKLLPLDKNGVEILNDGLQLVAIHLLARQPEEALKTLDLPQIATAQGTAEQSRQRSLLRARALADTKQYQPAFDVLTKISVADDSLSLITDTAWAAGRWDLAARSLELLLERSKPEKAALTAAQKGFIFNRAVALKLAGNEAALASLRAEYLDAFVDAQKTQFEVITRTSGVTTLADRETMLKMVQEVDLFQSFLAGSKK